MNREKLLKKYNLIYIGYLFALALTLVVLIVNRDKWINYFPVIFVVIFMVSGVFVSVYHYFEINADRKLITKMTFEGNFVLAEIHKATFEKTVKDATLKKYNIWKLEISFLEDTGEYHKAVMYDQFAAFVKQIPHGNCYITYDPNDPDAMFIIPNMLIGTFEENKEKVKKFEKLAGSKMKYLNVYYNQGLVIETYRETLERQQEIEEARKEA